MKQTLITWGLKGFYARTPIWAKHLIIAVITGYAALLGWMQLNPGLLPDNVTHYIMVGVPFLMVALKAFGIKGPDTLPTDPNLKAATTMTAIVLAVMLLVSSGAFAQVISREDVKAAKAHYLDTKLQYERMKSTNTKNGDTLFMIEGKREMIAMDSLYWRGLKAERHDQLLRIIK